VKTLDRYLVREILPPFLLALGLFTFLMAVKPMLDYAQELLVKGVPLQTVGYLLLTLLPQALGVTIPMALLTGILMGLGRLSADREAVAMLACGVSPLRLLRPVLALALVAGAANMYLLVKLVPDANQAFREVVFGRLAQMSENDIKPGVFYEGFPGMVIRVGALRPGGGWQDVMLADTRQPGLPAVTLARTAFLEKDEVRREVRIVLPGESHQSLPGKDGVYDTATATDQRFAVSADEVFGTGAIGVSRGLAEMTIANLRTREAEKIAEGISPHPEVMHRHQMLSFPVACLVFALIGVALGIHTRKEGKLTGLTLGLGVIALYYAVLVLFEDLTKGGQFSPYWARWVPNLVVGLIGLFALRAKMRQTGREWAIALPAWVSRLRRASADPATGHGGAPGRVVVVIRLPELPLPRIRLLDRYVARRYLSVAVLSFCGLLVLYYIATFIDKSERLFKGEATTAMLVEYFYHSTPQFIVHVAPMATLVAVLATIGGLTRTGELIVMRACGVSLYRVGLPLLVLSLVWSGGLFLLDDRVLAHANRRAEAIEDHITGSPSHTSDTIANRNWLAGPDGRIYYYSLFDIPTRTLYGLSIFTPVPDRTRLESHMMINKASFSSGVWTGDSGWVQSFPESGRSVRTEFQKRTLDLESPEAFSGMHNRSADLMTFGDLREHAARLAAGGLNTADTRVELARRLAFPFVTLVMTVLGISFGVSTGKRGALYGVGLALLLGVGYWLIDTFFVAIGQAGLLSPWFAAWAANLLFTALALYAIFTVRT
jgi:LPS export ABC transporter permease LptG/LPS export ABC transporter permease LptF